MLELVQYSIGAAINLHIIQDTFTKAKEWINKLKSLASPGVIIALAGNKADLEAHRRVDSKVSCISLTRMCVVSGADRPTHHGCIL